MRKPSCDRQASSKRAWRKEENQKFIHCIQSRGDRRWTSLPRTAGLIQCSNNCILQWSNSSYNNIRPDVERSCFAEDEEDLIIKLHALLGDRWSLIAGRLPGRTGNEIKNYWNFHLKRKLSSLGIDPNSHRVSGRPLYRSQSSKSSLTITISDKMKHECVQCQQFDSTVENDKVSDASSHQERINAYKLPDLNLEVVVPTQSSSLVEEERT